MKKVALLLTAMFILLAGLGCQNQNISHKDTFLLATQIAINHIGFVQDLALEKCVEDEIVAEECEDSIKYDPWLNTLSSFKQRLYEADSLVIGAEEINLLVQNILLEMDIEVVDIRTKLYIRDIRAILEMMLRDEEVRVTLKAMPPQ